MARTSTTPEKLVKDSSKTMKINLLLVIFTAIIIALTIPIAKESLHNIGWL